MVDDPQVVLELRRILKQYEDRYGIASDRLQEALSTGELVEDLDVCDWLIQDSVLRRAEHGVLQQQP